MKKELIRFVINFIGCMCVFMPLAGIDLSWKKIMLIMAGCVIIGTCNGVVSSNID